MATAALAIRNQFNPVASYSTAFSDDSVSGLVSLSYRVAPDALVYASYSRGSGGLNLTNLPAGIDPDVAPEDVDSFELGLKSQWFDRRVTFNAADLLDGDQQLPDRDHRDRAEQRQCPPVYREYSTRPIARGGSRPDRGAVAVVQCQRLARLCRHHLSGY